MFPTDQNLIFFTLLLTLGGAIWLALDMRQMALAQKVSASTTTVRTVTGAVVGGLAGLVGGQLLLIPLSYCMFNPEADIAEIFFGGLLAFAGTLIALPGSRWLLQAGFSGRGFAGLVAGQSSEGTFKSWWMPWVLLAPTLIVLALFLYYPALDNFRLSTLLARLGTSRTAFVCVDNFTRLLDARGFNQQTLLNVGLLIAIGVALRFIRGIDGWQRILRWGLWLVGGYLLFGVILQSILEADYYRTVMATFGISLAVVVFGLAIALGIAYIAYQPIRGGNIYRTFLIWPYAISPAVAGIIFALLFNPTAGIINHLIGSLGGEGLLWLQDVRLAPWTIIIASVWKTLGFNILFYIAGLQNVPADLKEAASIDGANAWQRFVMIIVPLLSPFTFFLLITGITFAFFETFGTIDFLTRGGPAGATSTMIYEIYQVGIQQSDLGKAAAQSIVLFAIVIGITLIQFRTTGSRVTYGA
jgi:sn-glycerol 3-phosphate transport system permease protein